MIVQNKKTILIVEDEFINREILKNILFSDYELLTAEDGKTALEILKEKQEEISLVLLDLQLPEMSGMEILSQMQSDTHLNNIPVIVLTSDKGQEVECLDLGASDFISKPYPNSNIILARIHRVIELYEDRKIIKETERDPLTKLYTKGYFYEYANKFDARNKDVEMDAVVVGIRSFHIIKERFGVNFSNALLVRFAKRLQKMKTHISGIVCHLEADMFIIYCKHIENCEEFLKEMSENIYVDKDKKTPLVLQIGVYQNVDKTIDIDMRFERAKDALEKIRSSVVKNISIFDNKLQDKEMFEEQLIEEFPKAIKEKQFVVYYQPKYNIQGEKPVLSSGEALIRWNHPKLGLISPGIFIPLFENKGLIRLLDLYVWEEAAAQMKRWKETLGRHVPVSVNVSRVDLYDPDLLDILKGIVERNGLEYSDLLLEVTESAYTDEIDMILAKIKSLREVGFKIEIDDFGTGYSSLSMINKIPLDALKIDMIFVRNAFSDQSDNQMIKIIIDLASYLKVPTIAEGVESLEQIPVLKTLGVDIVQGYCFSKPVPAQEFEKFIIK